MDSSLLAFHSAPLLRETNFDFILRYSAVGAATQNQAKAAALFLCELGWSDSRQGTSMGTVKIDRGFPCKHVQVYPAFEFHGG